jgi:peroxiredoxin
LADFQAMLPQLESEQIKVVAGSVDPLEKAKEIIEMVGITYPIGYGMNPEEISKVTGAYYEKQRNILHATGFLLRPDKTIAVACYSSGAIGRLSARDTLNLVKFYKSKK